jgi:MFS family permease
MKNFWNIARRFNGNIVLYLFYWSMIAFAYFGVLGVVFNLYLVRLGYEPEFIGRLHASGSLVWAVFALPAGAIGRQTGTKRALIAGALIIAAATSLMVAAESLPEAAQTPGLIAAWMLTWIGAALATVNGAPYLMSVTSAENRGFAFSAQQAVMGGAAFAGSLAAGALPGWIAAQLGVLLDQPAPYRFTLLLAPLAYLAGAVAFSRAKPALMPQQTLTRKTHRAAPLGIFIFFGMVVFMQSVGEGIVRPFFNLYLDTNLNVPISQIGTALGFSSLLLVLVSLVTPALLARWGSGGAMILTMFGFALFTVLLAGVPIWPLAGLIFFGFSSMLTVMATARGIYSQEIVLPQWRTTSSAIATIGLALGWAAAAWVAGFLIDSIGFQNMFLTGAVFALLGVGLMLGQKFFLRPGHLQETHDTIGQTELS